MIGFIAACLTTFGFVPQLIKILRTKDTSAISLGMYAMTVSGIALWFIHGVMIADFPLDDSEWSQFDSNRYYSSL